MKNKLMTAARRKAAASPKEHRAAFVEAPKHPVFEHATVVELQPTVTAANDRLKVRLAELEAEGWSKFYGGTSKGIVGLKNKQMAVRWLAVDKPRKK